MGSRGGRGGRERGVSRTGGAQCSWRHSLTHLYRKELPYCVPGTQPTEC